MSRVIIYKWHCNWCPKKLTVMNDSIPKPWKMEEAGWLTFCTAACRGKYHKLQNKSKAVGNKAREAYLKEHLP